MTIQRDCHPRSAQGRTKEDVSTLNELEGTSSKCIAASSKKKLAAMPLLLVAMHLLVVASC